MCLSNTTSFQSVLIKMLLAESLGKIFSSGRVLIAWKQQPLMHLHHKQQTCLHLEKAGKGSLRLWGRAQVLVLGGELSKQHRNKTQVVRCQPGFNHYQCGGSELVRHLVLYLLSSVIL